MKSIFCRSQSRIHSGFFDFLIFESAGGFHFSEKREWRREGLPPRLPAPGNPEVGGWDLEAGSFWGLSPKPRSEKSVERSFRQGFPPQGIQKLGSWKFLGSVPTPPGVCPHPTPTPTRASETNDACRRAKRASRSESPMAIKPPSRDGEIVVEFMPLKNIQAKEFQNMKKTLAFSSAAVALLFMVAPANADGTIPASTKENAPAAQTEAAAAATDEAAPTAQGESAATKAKATPMTAEQLRTEINNVGELIRQKVGDATALKRQINISASNPAFTSEAIEKKRREIKAMEEALLRARIELQAEVAQHPDVVEMTEKLRTMQDEINQLRKQKLDLAKRLSSR
ncbi:MAG: hypothetical protein ACOX9C_10870 [Kiritimatiellia bacterium]